MSTRHEGSLATMCRHLLSTACVTLAAALVAPTAAEACSGGDCETDAPPLVAELKGGKVCYGIFGEGVPFLNPYNDTRVNLALLLQDRKLLKLSPPPPKSGPAASPPGALAPASEYPVPFRVETLREPKNDPAGSPSLFPAQAELLALASRLHLDANLAEEALTRISATQTGRCAAENPQTLLDFVRAVAADAGLADAERTILAGERLKMAGGCLDMSDPPQALAVTSPAGQAFAAYLGTARHFYRDQLDAAEGGFAALGSSPAAWVAEAARYLIGRVHLNQAQFSAFKNYGQLDPAAVDRQKLALARIDLQGYLDAYPAGRYAASARGLFRRIDWLGRDPDAFVQDLATVLAAYDGHPPAAERMFELLDEVDSKYLSEGALSSEREVAWRVPELAATTVLTRMRDVKTAGDSVYRAVAAGAVVQHEADLAAAATPLLPDFLELAQTYWVDRDPAKVLRATEARKASAAMGNVEFSLLVLRGIALESVGRQQDANALWRLLLGMSDDALRAALLQLALALNDERSGKLAEVFAPGSPVREPALHRPLLKHAAPADLLRTLAGRADVSNEDKSTALFTLLYKQLSHGDARGFGDTLAQFPPQKFQDIDGLHLFLWKGQDAPDYTCPALVDTVQRLATAPNDPKALNCVSDFFYRFEDRLSPGSKPPDDELGGTPDGFAGKVRTRLDLYLAVIGKPQARGDAEAYALYRAVNSFASSGSNHCGNQEIPKEQRRRWFDQLKQTYKDNAWGRQQKYWW